MICSKFANEQDWTYFKNCILVRHYSCRHLENKICQTSRPLSSSRLPLRAYRERRLGTRQQQDAIPNGSLERFTVRLQYRTKGKLVLKTTYWTTFLKISTVTTRYLQQLSRSNNQLVTQPIRSYFKIHKVLRDTNFWETTHRYSQEVFECCSSNKTDNYHYKYC